MAIAAEPAVRLRNSARIFTTAAFFQFRLRSREWPMRPAVNLVVGAIGPDGAMRVSADDNGGIRIESAPVERERVIRSIRALADRGAIRVDSSDSAVILSTPGS